MGRLQWMPDGRTESYLRRIEPGKPAELVAMAWRTMRGDYAGNITATGEQFSGRSLRKVRQAINERLGVT